MSPQWRQTLLCIARAQALCCWAAQLCPELRRDAEGRRAALGSGGEEQLGTGTCHGADGAGGAGGEVERWAASAEAGAGGQDMELLMKQEDTSHGRCTKGVLQ